MAVRPIDANIAMKKIREYMEDFPNASTRLATCRSILSMLGDENQIPTLTPPNDWVSADERLPENYTDVLCWYEYFRHGDYNRMYQTYGIGYCINGQWGGEVSNGTKCKVLYWQPMPAPPDRRLPEGEEDT